MRTRIPLALAAAVLGVGLAAVPAGTAGAAGPVVVVSGLDNPRQLAWGADGSLLVAQAGRGAPRPNGTNCLAGPEGEACVGATGSIGVVAHPATTENGTARRVVSGLLSAASREGGGAVGPDGVTYQAGRVLAQVTYVRGKVPHTPAWQNGRLLRITKAGGAGAVADVSAVERDHNPDGLQVDSNPYGLLALGADRSVSADAAGNDLILVDHGKASALTVFPLHGCGGVRTEDCDQEPVPTSLALGPDKKLYVGELAHFEPGEARVWRVSPTTGKRLGWYGKGGTLCPGDTTGFTTVTGVAFGPDGSLYVSEFVGGADGGGDVVRITPGCTRTSVSVPVPGGVAVDRQGRVYVSAFSIADRDGADGAPPGQLWRISL